MASRHKVLLSCFLFLVALHGIQAFQTVFTYNAGNSLGGIRFKKEIGPAYSKQTAFATNFIWGIFQQRTPAERKPVNKVGLIIDNMDGVAYAYNNEIHVSANHIGNYSGDVKKEFTGVLYHELTHICQWDGNGQAPVGLIEGIADFVRLKSKYAPSHWAQPGQGSPWDKGYDVTARFLEYCNSLRNGFVAELNKKMRTGYSPDFFVQLLGKKVDVLWADYKAKYGNLP